MLCSNCLVFPSKCCYVMRLSVSGIWIPAVGLRWRLGLRRCCAAVADAMAAAVGLLLCVAWYYTILAGFFILYCPVTYLMFINHKIYRKVVDLLFALWELYPVALFQCCFNTKLHHFGDYVNPDEGTIVILNHRTRVDWNYVWIGLYHATQDPGKEKCIYCKERRDNEGTILDVGGKSKIKFVLKDDLKVVPGLGWIMQLNFFLYVKRVWQEDQVGLDQFIVYYSRMETPCRLVLFPEGTDLSESNKTKSHKFADANSLPHYQYVLHPRTTGWAALSSRMRGRLASVYDVTIAYDAPAQTEVDLLRGTMPRHVYFHFKRYSIEEIPSDEGALRSWLNNRWRDKESSLRKFYCDGTFIDPTSNKSPAERPPRDFLAAKLGFIFWTIVDLLFIYGICCSNVFRFWILYHCFLFIFVTWYFGGFHKLQYKMLEKYKKC